MSVDADDDPIGDLCFAARALAQTHPLSEPARRYRQRCFETERAQQPMTELADWASTALLVGYCLRRAEEQSAGVVAEIVPVDIETFTEEANSIGVTLRSGDAATVSLIGVDRTIAALDRIIATEVHKRHEHLREQLDDDAWSEFEDYITWWTVHGYCVRVAESAGR